MKKFKVLASIIITLLIFLVLVIKLDFEKQQFLKAINSINIPLVLLLISIYILSLLIRAIRFNLLLSPTIRINNLFRLVTIHQFYNTILPFKTGEFSFLYQLKKTHTRTYSEGFSCLLISRLMDFSAYLITLGISIFFSFIPTSKVELSNHYIYLVFGFSIILFFISTKISFITGVGILISLKIRRLLKLKLNKFILSLISISRHSKRISNSRIKFIIAFIISIIISVTIYLNTFLILISLNINLNFFQVVIASSFSFLTLMLPIQGFANFGTFEGAMIFGLSIFKISANDSLNAAIIIHILAISFITLLKIVIPTIIKEKN